MTINIENLQTYSNPSYDTSIQTLTWSGKPSSAEFGIGQAWFSDIASTGYSDGVNWYKGSSGLSTAQAKGYLTISSYGNSIDDMGSPNLAGVDTNDVSSFTGAIPGASENLTMQGVVSNFLACLYPMRKGNNCGVGGRSLATMVTNETANSTASTRKVLDAVNNAPNVLCWVGGVINDFSGDVYSAGAIVEGTYQTAVTNFKTILSYIVTANIELCLIMPCVGYSQGLPGITGSTPANSDNGNAVRNALVRFKNEIGAYITSLSLANIVYIDPVGVSCDSSGAFLTNYGRSSDGIHPDYWGAYNIALALKPYVIARFGEPASTLFPGKNIATSAMMANVSGGWPRDWAVIVNANGTLANQQIETINGVRWATAEITATSTNGLNFYLFLPFNPSNAANGTIAAMNVAVDDVYGIECDFFIEGKNGTLIKNLGLWQSYVRYTKTAGAVYLQPTFTFPQVAADVINHGRFQIKPNFIVTFKDAGSTLNASSCWFAPFSNQAVQIASGSVIKIGVANYRVVKL